MSTCTFDNCYLKVPPDYFLALSKTLREMGSNEDERGRLDVKSRVRSRSHPDRRRTLDSFISLKGGTRRGWRSQPTRGKVRVQRCLRSARSPPSLAVHGAQLRRRVGRTTACTGRSNACIALSARHAFRRGMKRALHSAQFLSHCHRKNTLWCQSVRTKTRFVRCPNSSDGIA